MEPAADVSSHTSGAVTADIGLRSLYYLGGIVLFSPRLLTLSEQPPPP